MNRWLRCGRTGAVSFTAVLLAACASGPSRTPAPRPLVIPSGIRLLADSARMNEVNNWVQDAQETIRRDPSFWLEDLNVPEPAYPWETLDFKGADTVSIAFEAQAVDARLSYFIYAFLHLMRRMDRLQEWFPEAGGLEGYELERFILAQTADSWLLGRSVWGTQPYGLMDELIYTAEAGYLDEFILTARVDDFSAAREALLEESPGRMREYLVWFRETFERDPPGGRGN